MKLLQIKAASSMSLACVPGSSAFASFPHLCMLHVHVKCWLCSLSLCVLACETPTKSHNLVKVSVDSVVGSQQIGSPSMQGMFSCGGSPGRDALCSCLWKCLWTNVHTVSSQVCWCCLWIMQHRLRL